MLDTSAKLTALASFIIIIVLATALIAYTPPFEGNPLDNGLIPRIRFEKDAYHAFEHVNATYEYYNPTSSPVTFKPASRQTVTAASLERGWNIEAGYDGRFPISGFMGVGDVEPVTLQPGDSYVAMRFHYYVIAPGTFRINANGTLGSVEILPGTLVARVTTDREVYTLMQGGTATLEVYNSGSSPLSYENFSPIELRAGYRYEPWEEWNSGGGAYVDYVSAFTTVQPGESHIIWKFYFSTAKAGTLILDFNNVVKTVTVLPSG
jgi:hypothetical protein